MTSSPARGRPSTEVIIDRRFLASAIVCFLIASVGSILAQARHHRRNWVMANQRLAGVLKTKGYHYQFVYAKNAGHVDAKVIRQTLPQALEYVWQDYPISDR